MSKKKENLCLLFCFAILTKIIFLGFASIQSAQSIYWFISLLFLLAVVSTGILLIINALGVNGFFTILLHKRFWLCATIIGFTKSTMIAYAEIGEERIFFVIMALFFLCYCLVLFYYILKQFGDELPDLSME